MRRFVLETCERGENVGGVEAKLRAIAARDAVPPAMPAAKLQAYSHQRQVSAVGQRSYGCADIVNALEHNGDVCKAGTVHR